MRLKHLVRAPIVAGLNIAAQEGEPSWPRFIRTTDVVSPRELGPQVVRVCPTAVGGCEVRQQDLLFCRTGSLGTVYFHESKETAAFAGYLVRVRPDPDKVAPAFLAYWAESSVCRQQIRQGTIRSTVDNFNATKVGNLVTSHVPLRDQQTVVTFLDRECRRIDNARKAIGELCERNIAAVFDSLRGLLVDRGWPFVPLKYYAETGTGHTPSRHHPEYWISDELVVPWFTLADVNQIRDGRRWTVEETIERISERGVANSSAEMHPPGTVLLSRTASVGFSAVMGREMAVSQDFMTWTCGAKLDPFYLLVALRTMQPELRRLMYGSTHKTIYMPDLHALRIPLPPLDEQRAIVADAKRRGAAAWRLHDELSAMAVGLRRYRDALITEAVTGTLDVTKLSEQQLDESAHAATEDERPEVLSV